MKIWRSIMLVMMIIIAGSSYAQNLDKQVKSILKKSEQLINQKKWDKAEKYLRYSINKVDAKDIIWEKLGEIAASKKDYNMAVEYYKMAMNFKPENKDRFELIVLKYLVLSHQYLDAEYQLMHIVPKHNWSQVKVDEYNKYRKFFDNKNMIYSNLNKEIVVENVGDAINSTYHEYFPSLSHDDSVMIFTRKFNGVEEDFFIVYKDPCNEQWYSAEHMGYPPNSTQNEGAQCLSYDRHYIFLMRCENTIQSYREAGGCDLYMSYTYKGEWVAPKPFGATINTNHYEGMPSLSADNKTLYFVSDRPGGYGGKDIWKSIYTPEGWSVPINLGPSINTEKDEISPFIAADNKTLYFSSNGHIGFGGFDIFKAQMDEDTFKSEPINLGLPYNSTSDDISWFLLANGHKAYWASDRPGGYGGMDIYTANVIDNYRPLPTTFIYGYVVDSLSHEAVTNAFIDIYDDEENLILKLTSNAGDGSFFVSLTPYKHYKFVVRRYDYPEKVIHYHAQIVAHHPPVDLTIDLLNWRDKKNLYEKGETEESPEMPINEYEETIEVLFPE